MNNNTNSLEDKIMSEIKSGRVKLRSKYIFLAEKFGFDSVLFLTVFFAVLFAALFFFVMKETDSLEYLSFGRIGFLAFLESFPYLFIIGFILLLLAAGFLISRTDWSYKKPFKYIALSLVVFALATGSVFAYSGITKKLEEGAYGGRPWGALFKPFFEHGLRERGRSIVGQVFETSTNYLILETPRGLEKINFAPSCLCDANQFTADQFLVAIGKKQGYDFIAEKIRLVERENLPMIERGVSRRLGPFLHCPAEATNTPLLPPHLLRFEEPVKNCLGDCFKNKQFPPECLRDCLK
jgi:hypothetical protein